MINEWRRAHSTTNDAESNDQSAPGWFTAAYAEQSYTLLTIAGLRYMLCYKEVCRHQICDLGEKIVVEGLTQKLMDFILHGGEHHDCLAKGTGSSCATSQFEGGERHC
ncbi:uncharacterized protein [Miscanthus floridulus]|uniref:uncharacterized protein n=1 Tax=Miscanthus floridulus TaxID=154761 RepID=UPI0034598553